MSGVTDLQDRTVLVRCDLGKGLDEDFAAGLRDLVGRGARVAVIAGYDNPGGDVNPTLSLRRLIEPLQQLTGLPVHFVGDCVGIRPCRNARRRDRSSREPAVPSRSPAPQQDLRHPPERARRLLRRAGRHA
jgi:3-phosphoglycerate kinase